LALKEFYMLYEHLSECPRVEGYSHSVAVFGIIGRESNLSANVGLPVLLMKQRAGDGEFPWCWDLPGGSADPDDTISDDDPSIQGSHDRSIRKTLQRELEEEVHIRSDFHVRIGNPFYDVRGIEKRIVEHHVFLVLPHGPPKESNEALNLAWVTWKSALGLKIARFEPGQRTMGPMAAMMHDGFSVLSKPIYDGPLTAEIKSMACSELSSTQFSLIDRGCYFARLSPDGSVKVYRRLHPVAPSGHCVGNLEHLA
jgi:8-oxo-dGTP pyrophosphatase MutT (NUDIX family)